tara:strand:+ start:253 stop:915 length:663 start_codon:yes stop_codon:yes gene_type:complete
MRISELSKTDSKILQTRKWSGVQKVQSFLARQGYDYVDEGVYSIVFAKPRGKFVVKVSKKEDVCYLEFARWASAQKNNPWLPKIKFMKDFQVTTRDGEKVTFLITAIEKLHTLKGGVISNIRWTHHQLPLLLFLSQEMSFGNQLQNAYTDLFKKTYGRDINLTDEYEMSGKFKKNSMLPRTIDTIDELLSTDCRKDMHLGNIMLRPGTKQIVIIDPLAAR